MRVLAWLAAVTMMSGMGVSAQTPADLLQRGIYTERTVGDLEAARRLYNQVIAATPEGSELRTAAEHRLRALEAQQHPPQPKAESVTAVGLASAVAAARSQPSTLEGNRYHHHGTDLTVLLPEGWRLQGTAPSSDHGDMAMFSVGAPTTSVNLWLIREANDAVAIRQRLDRSPSTKESERRLRYAGYGLRRDSVQRTLIGGHQAIVAIADYQGETRAMSECMAWVFSEQTHVFFFAHVAADDLDRFRPQFDSFVQSVSMP